ncbi:na+/H+ antiporter family protein, partial [Vibrio parahaemolyticus V-223/04]
NWLTS